MSGKHQHGHHNPNNQCSGEYNTSDNNIAAPISSNNSTYYAGSNSSSSNTTELEQLRQRLLDRDLTIAQLQSKMAEPSGHMMAAIRANTDHWQDSYHRLAEAHRRLQRVNQGLEDKLLKLADRSQSEKAALTEHISSLTTALTTAATAINRLKGEKERLQQDLNIAIQLLQCNSSRYGSHRIDALPADLQQKVRSHMDGENQRSNNNNNAGAVTKPTEMKVIKVPIPTFPPTAMVYSLNKCVEETPDEEEVQEAEDMVSAAIMAAVLEERQKDQKHCPTCTCYSHHRHDSSRTATLAADRSKSSNSSLATTVGKSANAGVNNNSSASKVSSGAGGGKVVKAGRAGEVSDVRKCISSSKGGTGSLESVVSDSSVLPSCHMEGKSARNCALLKRTAPGRIVRDKQCLKYKRSPSESIYAQWNFDTLGLSDKSGSENCSSAEVDSVDSMPLIDLNSDSEVLSVTKPGTKKKDTTTIVELNSLNVTEHFNSENLKELSVNKCICGRPYSIGSNVIDVGTQTVPSYIGESGKVHSTCIYCKGQKIKDRHREKKSHKSDGISNKRNSNGTSTCSSKNCTKISQENSDIETVSILSISEASCYGSDSSRNTCSGSENSNSNDNMNSSSSSKSAKEAAAAKETASTSTSESTAAARISGSELVRSSSCSSWEWPVQVSAETKREPEMGGDSGSPSTPSSFTSSSGNCGSSSLASNSYYESDHGSLHSPLNSPRTPQQSVTTQQHSSYSTQQLNRNTKQSLQTFPHQLSNVSVVSSSSSSSHSSVASLATASAPLLSQQSTDDADGSSSMSISLHQSLSSPSSTSSYNSSLMQHSTASLNISPLKSAKLYYEENANLPNNILMGKDNFTVQTHNSYAPMENNAYMPDLINFTNSPQKNNSSSHLNKLETVDSNRSASIHISLEDNNNKNMKSHRALSENVDTLSDVNRVKGLKSCSKSKGSNAIRHGFSIVVSRSNTVPSESRSGLNKQTSRTNSNSHLSKDQDVSSAHTKTSSRPYRRSVSNELDDSNSLEVSADLLARLTNTIDCFDLKVQELTSDYDNLRVLDKNYRNNVSGGSNNLDPSTFDIESLTSGIITDIDDRLSNSSSNSKSNNSVNRTNMKHIGSVINNGKLYSTSSEDALNLTDGFSVAASIHRVSPSKCSADLRRQHEARVVASTTTASATVTSL